MVGTGGFSGTPVSPGRRFTLALDGRSFVASILRVRADLWMLEHFSPPSGLSAWFRRS